MAKSKKKSAPKPKPVAGNKRSNKSASNASGTTSSFSLKDAAIHTERQHRSIMSNRPLRYESIKFVSAGTSTPELFQKDNRSTANADSSATTLSDNIPNKPSTSANLPSALKEMAHSTQTKDSSVLETRTPITEKISEATGPSQSLFVVDTHGSDNIPETGFRNPQVRSPSPTPSDSSEEEIVFKGRAPTETVQKPRNAERPIQGHGENVTADPKAPTGNGAYTPTSSKQSTRPSWDDSPAWGHREDRIARTERKEDIKPAIVGSAIESTAHSSRRSKNARKRQNRRLRDEGDEALDDYISNMLENNGSITEHDKPNDSNTGHATYTVWEWSDDHNDDDEEENSDENDLDEDNDDDDSGSGSEYDELARLRDEEDLLERRIARMTDEQIARILSKQEELGMGSADILLFDGLDVDDEYDDDALNLDYDDDGDGSDDDDDNIKFNSAFGVSFGRSKGKGVDKKAFTLQEQPYGNFDVMDFERPSLQAGSKFFDSGVAYEGLDDDQRIAMHNTWEADRMKKRQRKQERQELRAQGLLGNRKGKPDLSARYSQGINVQQAINEIHDFLMSGHNSQPFPPMDKSDRKMLHIIANVFNLKSKSVGSGKSRSPVLYKTSKTVPVENNDAFARAEAKAMRIFGSHPNIKSKGRKSKGLTPRRGGTAAASYQDGDVVGHGAPEIGAENKGRGLLEKMGWSHGMALGSEENKGILHPLEHVVKNSKSGLG